MVATIEQVQRGVSSFIENEVGRKSTGLMKFGVYFLLPSLPTIVGEKVKGFMDTPGFCDMFDSAGNVQLDTVYNRAKDAINKIDKLELPEYHITLEASDIDAMYNYIRNA